METLSTFIQTILLEGRILRPSSWPAAHLRYQPGYGLVMNTCSFVKVMGY